jgi:transcriptional regulator with XRE-family HTH domain
MLFGRKIRQLREKKQMLQRQFAAALEINTPVYSKIKRCEHPAKHKQLITLAKIFKINPNEFSTFWLADQIIEVIKNEKEL